jgi:fumarylpyruvate hydrolase
MTPTDFWIAPEPPPTVTVLGRPQRFAVRRIYCVGRNYADHVREMGGDPKRDPPRFFSKPANAVVDAPTHLPYPLATTDLHHEVEWVVALDGGGHSLSAEQAAGLVCASAVGLDLTRRDLQAQAKKEGSPWDTAKGFDRSAPLSPLRPGRLDSVDPQAAITLAVNGDMRQSARLAQMIWSAGELLSQLSTLYELRPGDLVFTGTPAGVGALRVGDRVTAAIAGVGELALEITPFESSRPRR